MATDCKSILESLSDPERRLSEQVREHLASCPDCRASAGAIDQLESSRLEPEPLRLTGFAARVAVRRSSRSRHAKVLGGVLAAGAVAAAAIFGLMLPSTPGAPAAENGEARPSAELVVASEESEAFPEDLEWEYWNDWEEDDLLEGELAQMDQLLDWDDEGSDIGGT